MNYNVFFNTMYTIFQIDLSNTMAYIMAPKEDVELSIIKKASQATMDLYNKYLKEQIMTIVDSEKVSSYLIFI